MDSFDVFTSESTTAKANETANDGSSWVIEDHPAVSDEIPPSQGPTASNNNDLFETSEQSHASNDQQLETDEQLYTLPAAVANDEQPHTLPPPTASDFDQFETAEQLHTLPAAVSNDEQLHTLSPSPTASYFNQFETVEQSYTIPPPIDNSISDYSSYEPAEDKGSFDIFSTEAFSPLQAVLKRREEEIAAKDAEENRKIAILREQAKTDLENWYNERQRQLEQKLQRNKIEENDSNKKNLEKSTNQSCDWSKVIRLIDFTDGKQLTRSKRDLTRMKESIFNAKRIIEKEKLANGN